MVPDVFWIRDIEPLRLAMMPRPRGGDWLEDEISGWRRAGIEHVVSLLHPYEAAELDISAEALICTNLGIRYQSFPIRDRATPDSEVAFFSLADELASLMRQGVAVAVHCRAGIGRSGLLAAVILLRLGVSASEVFGMLSKARGVEVPDTDAQADWFHSVAARYCDVVSRSSG